MKLLSAPSTIFYILLAASVVCTGQSVQRGNVDLHISSLSGRSIPVSEAACFDLTVRDSKGNIIRAWDQTGNVTTIILRNSTANTDTSRRSWNEDPNGFSYAYLVQNNTKLLQISDSEWALPSTAFVEGNASVCLTDTKAETGVYLEIAPTSGATKQVTADMNFLAEKITNYLVEITSATAAGNQVFHMRPYEIVVSPRDRFLNVSKETIRTQFSARWPGEFDKSDPGLADLFTNDAFISGPTSYLLASRIIRMAPKDVLQYLIAFAADDPSIIGQSSPYEILSHAPASFKLLDPKDNEKYIMMKAMNMERFIWEKPVPADPFTNIRVSRSDSLSVSDDIRYTWIFMDAASRTNARRFPSDGDGRLPVFTTNHGQLVGLMTSISGRSGYQAYNFLWCVEATDGLYTTMSQPLPGHRLRLEWFPWGDIPPVGSASATTLDQNHPNPFNPGTTISFITTKTGKVSLKIYDLFGKEVATVVNKTLEAGEYSETFNAGDLPSGTYIYRLCAEGNTFAKRMTLLR